MSSTIETRWDGIVVTYCPACGALCETQQPEWHTVSEVTVHCRCGLSHEATVTIRWEVVTEVKPMQWGDA